MNCASLCQQHPHWQTLHNKLALLYSFRAIEEQGNRKDPFKLLLSSYLMNLGLLWSICQASICSLTPTSKFISQAEAGARFRPIGYLSNKTFGSILAQAMSRHRVMPADSWTKQLRNAQKEGDCDHCSLWLSSAQFCSVKDSAEHGEDSKSDHGETVLTICGLWRNISTLVLPSLCLHTYAPQ